jgi:hypothetical protein
MHTVFLTLVKMEIMRFLAVTSCSLVGGCQIFKEPTVFVLIVEYIFSLKVGAISPKPCFRDALKYEYMLTFMPHLTPSQT